MTIIVAKKEETGIIFGADAQVTAGSTKRLPEQIDVSKLHQANGITLGSAGLARTCNMLGIFMKTHLPKAADTEGILDWLWRFERWVGEYQAGFSFENVVLIAFESELFYAYELEVFRVPEYGAIGSGQDFAMGALYQGCSVEQAVETAIALDNYCAGPVTQLVHPIDAGDGEQSPSEG